MFAAISFVSVSVLALAGSAAVLAVLIYFIKHREEFENGGYFKLLLKSYTYFMLVISVLLASLGAYLTVKSSISFVLGVPFSYEVNQRYNDYDYDYGYKSPYDDEDTITIDGQQYTYDADQRQVDIINGITLFATSLIVLAGHKLLLVYIERKDKNFEILDKLYTLTNLTLYSIISIIAIPGSIYQMLTYYFIENDNLSHYGRAIPGESLAIALIASPIWILFIVKALNIYRKEDKAVTQEKN